MRGSRNWFLNDGIGWAKRCVVTAILTLWEINQPLLSPCIAVTKLARVRKDRNSAPRLQPGLRMLC